MALRFRNSLNGWRGRPSWRRGRTPGCRCLCCFLWERRVITRFWGSNSVRKDQMFRNKFGKLAPIAVLLNCLLVSMIAVAAEKISNPEELVAKHLESLGTAQARSDAKSRADEGTVRFRVLSGGVGQIDGQSVLLSEGRKVLLMM